MEFNVIEKCTENYESFKKIIESSSNYEPKGIFNSELLMLTTMIKELGIEHLIESGRARGQSTEITTRFCKDNNIKFDSIEFDKNSPDVEIATKRLSTLKDYVGLYYGDAFDVMPTLITEKQTAIMIDGPKGFDALKLGIEMISKHKNVKAVFFHDVNLESEPRKLLNKYFKKAYFSDYKDFVEKFKSLDESCWRIQSTWPEAKDWAPYTRHGKYIQSYSATLGVILSDNSNKYDTILAEVNKMNIVQSNIIYRILNKLSRLYINRI